MKKKTFAQLILGACSLFLTATAWASHPHPLLNQAQIFVSQGKQAEAIEKYQHYIATHPAVTRGEGRALPRNFQYQLRNLLIAYSHLIEQQKALGLEDEVQKSLAQLKQIRQHNEFGSKNLYSLARIYKNNGDLQEAMITLQTIVADQQRAPRKSNNKVFVRACAGLVEIHRTLGSVWELEDVLYTAFNGIESLDLDLRDRYRVGRLLLENGDKKGGEKVLAGILEHITLDDLATEENAIIRTVLKLLEINAGNTSASNHLVELIAGFDGAYQFSVPNQYRLAIALLNSGHEKRGLKALEQIKDNHPQTTHARRALFVLGRAAASASHWDKAISHYGEYISRYTEPRFFSLKAYSRLIDCQWAKLADHDLIAAEAQRLADLANDIADYETQLNLARDLKDKGFEELAQATFDLGLSDARNQLRKNITDRKRLRILWNLQRYAYPLERFDLVEDCALEAVHIMEDPHQTSLHVEEKPSFIKSQSLIWLGQARQRMNRPEDARMAYAQFLEEFQESRDADYVRFLMGRSHEDQNQLAEARKHYRKVKSGVWKEQATRKLQGWSPKK